MRYATTLGPLERYDGGEARRYFSRHGSHAAATASTSRAYADQVAFLQKQCVVSVGVWEKIRRVFAVDANRSTGVPLNPYYRNPTPGGTDPMLYDDPVTTPAGDIADNPYWKRDARRAYPKLSFVNQSDAVGLLSVGSAAAPKQELIGEAGAKSLVAAKQEGETGLAAFFEKKTGAAVAQDLLVGGLPPLPSGQSLDAGKWDVYKYDLTEPAYGEEKIVTYPCRSFK